MSTVSIAGTLILQGDLICDGDVNLETSGKIIPIANEVTETVFSCPIQDYVSSNGKSPTITSTTSDINIRGTIDGLGQGFPANFGPGANSTLKDNRGNNIEIYGATHAGLGYVTNIPGELNVWSEDFTLNSLQVDQRQLVLTYYPPEPSNVAMNIIKGTSQEYYRDFEVNGNVLTWRTPRLEPLINSGDKIRVVYLGDTGREFPPPRKPYGSYLAPTSIGSGSGEAAGGSGIKLVALSGTVNITGTIDMNGQNGTTTRSGGGSGGSVWVVAYDVTGNGIISADGGTATYQYAGGGGGGYITFNYENSYAFTGSLSVEGLRGGTKGVISIEHIEPFFIEKFTGHILNAKWWEVIREPVSLDNVVEMDTPIGDFRDPEIESHFNLSGRNIHVDVDYIPSGSEPSYHTSYFHLYVDQENYVGIARKYNHIMGVYSIDGYPSQTGIEYPYIPTTFRILKSDSTFTFQFVDSSAGPQTLYSQVIPEFANSKFYSRVGTVKDPIDASRRVDYFSLTDVDITNKYVTLSADPSDDTNVAMNILNSSAQYYGLDYYVDGQKLRWDSSTLPIITPVTVMVTDHITLTATDIANRSAYLSAIPKLPHVAMNIVKGSPQNYGIDFFVIEDRICWWGKTLDGALTVGDQIRVQYLWSSYNDPPLEDLLAEGDLMSAHYVTEFVNNDLQVNWDNYKIYNGILGNAETREATLYVDQIYGSDTSAGTRLAPLQHLFVATAWAKRGGTVVLYDGQYMPTEVLGKNLTVMGANGVRPIVSCSNTQDTTGSNWEYSALTFRNCQGLVRNLSLRDAREALYAENTQYFEMRQCEMRDSSVGAKFVEYSVSPKIMQNTIHDVNQGIIIEDQAYDPYVYSNVIYDASNSVLVSDATNLIISSNTFDRATTGIVIDQSTIATLASNNISNMLNGVYIDSDSCAASYHNNFFGTTNEYIGGGTVTDNSGNIWINPQYVNDAAGDYHILRTSPVRGQGTDDYDFYFLDRDNNPRPLDPSYDIGSYEFVDGSHIPGSDYYVSSTGSDYLNFGNQSDPYRTLDKAMSVADQDIHIDGGHYDSYWLELAAQNINLNTLSVYTASQEYVVTYLRLTALDASRKFFQIPGFATVGQGLKNIALNVVKGSSQELGVDYTVAYGTVFWENYALDGLLTTNDMLRLQYSLETRAGNTLRLDSHFSNIDLGNTLFVSPNGSDSSVFGGDGTNSGGNGSYALPYRSIDRAMQDASVGTNIIAFSGEYDIFTGRDQRVLVPFSDRTGIGDSEGRYYLQSLFETPPTAFENHVISGSVWDTYSFPNSDAFIQEGFLSIIYDGTNDAGADSTFTFTPQFEATTELRQAFDSIFFSVHNKDNTAVLEYNNGDWTSSIVTGGELYQCWGHLDVAPAEQDVFFTDYVCVSSEDIGNKYVALSYLLEDSSNVTVNIVGGPPQELGTDFYAEDGKIKWDGLSLEDDVQAGELIRAMYKARGLSEPVRVQYIMDQNNILTLRGSDYRFWSQLMKKQLVGDTTSPWSVSFFMNKASDIDHSFTYGRGYVSKFSLIAKTIEGTTQAEPYRIKTWRQPVILYNEDPGNP